MTPRRIWYYSVKQINGVRCSIPVFRFSIYALRFAFSELLARVQALIRRAGGTTEPARLTLGDLSVNLLKRKVIRAGKNIELQPREFALLEYLMRNADRIVSKTMILEHVWDYHFDPQTNVVDVLVCRLRNRVDRGFPEKMIHTIRGVGYVIKASA